MALFHSLCSLPPSVFFFFFFNDTATTEIYTLSLHDALPIFPVPARRAGRARRLRPAREFHPRARRQALRLDPRSEEHTSELQSQSNLVCRLLLEKKKKKTKTTTQLRNKTSVNNPITPSFSRT